MAGFEISRIGSVGDMAREWKAGKLLPLYAAGIAVGVAAGVGLTMQGQDPAPAAIRLPARSAPAVLQASPSFVLEPSVAPVAVSADPEASHVVLPETMLLPVVAPAPVAPAAAPVLPVTPTQAPAPAAAPAQAIPVAVKPAPVPESAPAPVAPAAPAPKSDFYVPAVASGGASSLEQRLFDGMNAERAKSGLPPFTYDAGLTKVARTRSQQMADQNYFAHVDPSGYSMYTALLKHFGYTSYAWAGENLAMNNYAAAEASERSLVTLMNSPTHRANILANDFFRVGVGEVTTADGRHIFAMIFLG